MSKTQDEFLDHFARLGVFSKVQALMEPDNEINDATTTTVHVGVNAITATTVEDQLNQSSSSGITSSTQQTTTATGTYE